MTGSNFTLRENEILQILETVYSATKDYSLIGGYAVDSYSPITRYSVDCDLVISKNNFEFLTNLFKENEYRNLGRRDRDEYSDHEVWHFQKFEEESKVSIDLLVDTVKCRQTEAVWTYKEIRNNSQDRKVIGATGSVSSIVASREQLIAMKLNSARGPDLKDVVMLMDSVDWRQTLALIDRDNKEKVIGQLNVAFAEISKEEFTRELRTLFSSKAAKYEKRIELATDGIKGLLKSMKN